MNFHTQDVLRKPALIQMARDKGLVTWCWGNDNNSKKNIAWLKSMGMDGVIYDRSVIKCQWDDAYSTWKVTVVWSFCEEKLTLNLPELLSFCP